MSLRNDLSKLLGRFGTDQEVGALADAIYDGDSRRTGVILRRVWDRAMPQLHESMGASFVSTSAGAYNAAWQRLPGDDVPSPAGAVKRAQKQAGRRVTLMTSQSRDVIRRLVTAAVAGGKGFEALAARMCANGLGMDRVRAGAHAKLFDELRSDLGKGKTTRAKALRKLARDKKRKVRSRARTIARTELGDAREYARQRAWSDAVKRGKIKSNEWTRVWHTSNDDKVDEVCIPLSGATTGINKPFFDGTMRPPRHPNCRCTTSLRRKN